jgi:hypothetical protein
MAHEATTDYYIDEVPDVNPLMIQIHSYDTRNRNYSSAIVTAGYADRRYSVPIYDWSGVLGGMIDRTAWIVQPAGVIGNTDPVTTPEFYATYSQQTLVVYDEDNFPHNIPFNYDLVGYALSSQLNYRSDEIDMCRDHEWLIHIECDELPNSIEDSTEADFYGGAGFPLNWQNFQTIVDYYHPMSANLLASLDTMAVYVDQEFSIPTSNVHIGSVTQNRVTIAWSRARDPNFESYRIYYDTVTGVGTQSPLLDADVLPDLCWQGLNQIIIQNLLYDQDYFFRFSAVDRFGYETELSEELTAHTENTPRLLTPVGGELWDYRTQNVVRWTGDGFDEGVWIELKRNYPNGEWELLAEGLENDWEEAVIVGEPLADNCRIRVRTENGSAIAVSPANFQIISALGYLQVEFVDDPGEQVFSWDAGSLECPDSAAIEIQFSNPGYTPVAVLAPYLAEGDIFQFENDCLTEIVIPAESTAVCTMRVSFASPSIGIHLDTLRIPAIAVNAENNLISFPLTAERTSTVTPPEIVLTREDNSIRISWNPIEETVQGCPINPTYQIWYYPDDWQNRIFLGDVTDTTFLHSGAIEQDCRLFYDVQIIGAE